MYTFTNTEINNEKATDFETKSMLYLLGMHPESDEVEIIAVDCFNDVTGADLEFNKLWDIQSKNHSNLPPSKIGESLITLYNNFTSTLSFHQYILFIPKLNRDYLINGKLNSYNYNNFKPKQKTGIEKKLKEKINGNKSGTTPTLFEDFLNSVLFIEDFKNKSSYIKSLSKFKNSKTISEEVYERIFKEIRDAQSVLKNSYIENVTISQASDVMKLNRHITKTQILTLIISRFVGIDIFSFPGVPIPFLPCIDGLDKEEVTDLLQDCNENLSRAFFDKNGCKEFWQISEKIIFLVRANIDDEVNAIYETLTKSTKIETIYLTSETIKYMISLVKAGLKNDC